MKDRLADLVERAVFPGGLTQKVSIAASLLMTVQGDRDAAAQLLLDSAPSIGITFRDGEVPEGDDLDELPVEDDADDVRQGLDADAAQAEAVASVAYSGIYGLIGRVARLGLSPTQFVVYMVFVGFRNSKTGKAWPGDKRVARVAELTVRQVKDARRVLQAAGLLVYDGQQTEGRRADRAVKRFVVRVPTHAQLGRWQARVQAARKRARRHRKVLA